MHYVLCVILFSFFCRRARALLLRSGEKISITLKSHTLSYTHRSHHIAFWLRFSCATTDWTMFSYPYTCHILFYHVYSIIYIIYMCWLHWTAFQTGWKWLNAEQCSFGVRMLLRAHLCNVQLNAVVDTSILCLAFNQFPCTENNSMPIHIILRSIHVYFGFGVWRCCLFFFSFRFVDHFSQNFCLSLVCHIRSPISHHLNYIMHIY